MTIDTRQTIIYASLLIFFTCSQLLGSNNIKPLKLNHVTSLIETPIMVGVTHGTVQSGVLMLTDYLFTGRVNHSCALILGSLAGFTSAAATALLFTDYEDTPRRLRELEDASQYLADLHNKLSGIMTQHEIGLSFAKFLLKIDDAQSNSFRKKFSLEDSKKLRALYNIIEKELPPCVYPTDSTFNPYIDYGSRDVPRLNYDSAPDLPIISCDRCSIILPYLDYTNMQKIKTFNQEVGNESQLKRNIVAIYQAYKSNKCEKMCVALQIKNEEHKLKNTPQSKLDKNIIPYCNMLYFHKELRSRYCKIKYDAQFDDLFPQFAPYVIPTKIIHSLLYGSLRLQTLEPLKQENPLTRKTAEEIHEIYWKDERRLSAWQSLIKHCSPDDVNSISETLFPQSNEKLDDELARHEKKLANKKQFMASNKINPEKILYDSWRIELPNTHIKG